MWIKFDNAGTGNSVRLRHLVFIVDEDTTRTEATTLRRVKVSKVFGTWNLYTIAVGMDELASTATLAILQEWWKADRTWIHASNAAIEPDEEDTGWVEVVIPSGKLPLTYPAKGNKRLPSFAATVSSKYGVV